MTWSWEAKGWPDFTFELNAIQRELDEFFMLAGELLGVSKVVSDEDKQILMLEIITNEALKTSEIEGEIFNRESVQSSIQRHFGQVIFNYRVDFKFASPIFRKFHIPKNGYIHSIYLQIHFRQNHGGMEIVDSNV
jgi:hypothetical protein